MPGGNPRETLIARYGKDYFGRIGHIGGSKVTEGTKRKGFGTHREMASAAGKIGGQRSRKSTLAQREATAKAYTKTPEGQIWQALQ